MAWNALPYTCGIHLALLPWAYLLPSPPRLCYRLTMRAHFKAGLNGRVPMTPEQRFFISFSESGMETHRHAPPESSRSPHVRGRRPFRLARAPARNGAPRGHRRAPGTAASGRGKALLGTPARVRRHPCLQARGPARRIVPHRHPAERLPALPCGARARDVVPLLYELPAESRNQITRQTAHFVFGPDYNPAVFATALAQQGLLQLFHDYCLPDRLAALPQWPL